MTEEKQEGTTMGTGEEQETRRGRRTQEENEGKCMCYVKLMEDLSVQSLVTVRSKVCFFSLFHSLYICIPRLYHRDGFNSLFSGGRLFSVKQSKSKQQCQERWLYR